MERVLIQSNSSHQVFEPLKKIYQTVENVHIPTTRL